MDRIARSWAMFKASLRVLRTRKELALFPVLSGIATLIVAAGFVVPALLASRHAIDAGNGLQPVSYVLFFLGYLVLAYIAIFFQAALVSQADVALRGGDPSVAGGIEAARRKAGAILPWALLSATVSLVLRSLEDRAGVVGRFAIGLVGMAWTLVTYLVVPILVLENVTVGAAIRGSSALFKRTWGENVVGNAGVGLVSFLAALPGVAVFAIGASSGGAGGVALMVLGGAWLVLVTVVSSALAGIYQTALYRYAASGSVAPAFADANLGQAFPPRAYRSSW
ncbi:MAG TPA: DUF6159 family protein [Jatrophihabitantaceae bacterium]|jgi:hypothetical protein